jgi:hypothetical protein
MARRWRDDADWTDIEMVSIRNEGGKFDFNGYPHVTIGEQMLAELLTGQGIPYTPEVRMTFRDENGRHGVTYVPDFVFNKTAYVWEGIRKQQFLIHGIEVKRASRGFFSGKAIRLVRLLKSGRRITILLMSHRQIEHWRQVGHLPLRLPRLKRHKQAMRLFHEEEQRQAKRRRRKSP